MKRFFSGLFSFIQNICLGIVICLIGMTTFLYFNDDFNLDLKNIVKDETLMGANYDSDLVGYEIRSRETSLIASEQKGAKKILIPVENGKAYLRSTQIMYVTKDGIKASIISDDELEYFSNKSIESLFSCFEKGNKGMFFQTNDAILNIEYIRELKSKNIYAEYKERSPKYRYSVKMADRQKITISQKRYSELTKIMKDISIN